MNLSTESKEQLLASLLGTILVVYVLKMQAEARPALAQQSDRRDDHDATAFWGSPYTIPVTVGTAPAVFIRVLPNIQ